jgi:hypothetical protein
MEYSPIVRFTPLVPPAIARAGTAQRAVPTDNIGMHRVKPGVAAATRDSQVLAGREKGTPA